MWDLFFPSCRKGFVSFSICRFCSRSSFCVGYITRSCMVSTMSNSNAVFLAHAYEMTCTASKKDLGMQGTSLILGVDWPGGKATKRSVENDVETGKESAQLGMDGQNIDQKGLNALDKTTVNELELAKHLEEKGWSESTRGLLLKKYNQQKLSYLVVSRVLRSVKDVVLASSLFDWVCEHMGHDISVYYAYLSHLAVARQHDRRWTVLTKMKANGIEVSYIAFSIMIRACKVAGVPSMAIEVFRKASEYGVDLNIELYQELLETLFLSNSARDARLLYSRMIQQGLSFGITTYNTLISGFGLTSGIEDVQKSFNILLKAGIKPSLGSYEALISAYCNVHAIDKAMSVFIQLGESGLTTDANGMNIILKALCKDGNFNDAINFIGSAQNWCIPDMHTFITILTALLSRKEVSKAIGVFQLMEENGLTNRWTYITLSNGLQQCPQTEEIQDFLGGLFAKYGYGNAEVCHALLYNLISVGPVDAAEDLFKGIIQEDVKPILPAYEIMISFYCGMKMPDRALQLISDLKDKGLKPTVFCYIPITSALLSVSRMADVRRCFQEMQDHGYESSAICNHLLREVCRLDMSADIPEILSIMLRNNFVMRSSTFFHLAKCMCKAGKMKETNILCRSLFKSRCLELSEAAAQQVFGVMKVMPMAC
ncbi:hypothetical protein L7F22_042989 [Adiantum nelumboides]|nr:hypothetical protein [Adiantum nelumboides]